MRLKNIAALLAASSLTLTSVPAAAAQVVPADIRASAPMSGESEMFDSGLIGFGLVFGLGLIAGYLLSTVLDDGEDDRVSP